MGAYEYLTEKYVQYIDHRYSQAELSPSNIFPQYSVGTYKYSTVIRAYTLVLDNTKKLTVYCPMQSFPRFTVQSQLTVKV